MSPENKPLDLLGIQPLAKAVEVSVEKTLETAQTFLFDLCRPAAAEAGLLLRDKVRVWRAKNLANIANGAKQIIQITSEGVQLQAPPRIVHEVMEHGSWCEDEQMQKMWAGLLAGSCTQDGKDESNILFADILKRLTPNQAKLLEFVCVNCEKGLEEDNHVRPYGFVLTYEDVQKILGCQDKSEVVSHLGHLRSLGLLNGGGMTFLEIEVKDAPKPFPNLTPHILGLSFYVRCQGSRKSVRDFFNVTEPYERNKDRIETHKILMVRA